MAATLKQIAERTGLSIPTVHQILNNYKVRFSPATREKVLEAAAELRYTPNLAARSLVQQRSSLMGVLFYGVNYGVVLNFYRGVQAALHARGYAPIFMTHANVQEELANVRLALERHVDGIILNVAIEADGSTQREELIDLIGDTPTIEIFGQFLRGTPNVRLDYEASSAAAVQQLRESGHRSIALLVREKFSQPSERFWSARDFVQGYQSSMRKAGLKPIVQPYAVAEDNTRVDAHFHGAYQVAGDVIGHAGKPSAAVCYGRESADALIRWCEKNRSDVPDGFTVAYFGDPLPVASDAVLQLAFPVPAESLGKMAVDATFELLDGASPQSARLAPSSGRFQGAADPLRSDHVSPAISIRREPVSKKAVAKRRRAIARR